MKLKTILRSTLLLGVLAVPTGCDSLVDNISVPNALETPQQVFSNITNARSFTNSIYAALRDANRYGNTMIIAGEGLGDNVSYTEPGGNRGRNFVLGESIGMSGAVFSNYLVINRANLVLDNIDGVPAATTAEKNSLKSQALFLRALLMFDIIRTFSYLPTCVQNSFDRGMPYPTRGNLDAAFTPDVARPTLQQNFVQLEADLVQARDIGAVLQTTAASTAGSQYFGNRAAINALLARVRLYRGDWAGAASAATDAITDATTLGARLWTATEYSTATSIRSAWAAFPKAEALFELNYAIVAESLGANNSIATVFFYDAAQLFTGDLHVARNLAGTPDAPGGAMDLADRRRGLLFAGDDCAANSLPSCRLFYNAKWNQRRGGNFGWDNTTVIRLSEVYLIRAEARAQAGDLAGAAADVNVTRVRAGLPAVDATTPNLLQVVRDERRIELAFEGHRFFDLKRWCSPTLGRDAGFTPVNITDFRILAGIPQREVELGGFQQNPGY